MATIGALNPSKSEVLTTAHIASLSRGHQGYYVVSGCDCTQSGVGAMTVTVDAGVIVYNGSRIVVPGNTVSITTADATYPRIEVIYINGSGVAACAIGTAADIEPALETTTHFTHFTVPFPNTSIPAGPILTMVHVRPATTSILTADLNDIATFGPDLGVAVGNLVQVAAGGKYPAMDGSNITNVQGMRPYNIEFQFDSGGLVLLTGYRPGYDLPVAGNITSARLMSADNTSGSIVINVYKATYANAPGTLTLIDTFSISTATKSVETGLSIAVAAGDWIIPNITSCTSLKNVTLSMTVTVT